MNLEWTAISEEREKEWMQLASEMIQGTIFEYFPEKDVMVYTQYKQDGFHVEKSVDDYFKRFRAFVHSDDWGEVERLMEQIREKRTVLYAEARTCLTPGRKDIYHMSAFQGIGQYNERGKLCRIIGQMYRFDDRWKENKQKLYSEARRDSMTYLWNYKYTKEYIVEFLRLGKRSGTFFIIDIDNFKKINDTMGHLFGNEVILSVSRALKSVFSDSDIIGRVGGDEFVVFMKDETSRRNILEKCNAVCRAVKNVYCGEKGCQISASIGTSRYPMDGKEYDTLFEKADAALYYVKKNGKNSGILYDGNLEGMETERTETCPEPELVEEREEEIFDQFYYEMTELMFKLMGDTTDTDSAVQLLLHKIKEHFKLQIVSVQEIVREQPGIMHCIYEAADPETPEMLHKNLEFTEAEWMLLLHNIKQGKYWYTAESSMEVNFFPCLGSKFSALKVPLGDKDFFSGVMDFIYLNQDHSWDKKEVKFLETFAKMLSLYLLRGKTLDEANYLAMMMQERDSTTGLYSYDKFLERMREINAIKEADEEILYVYYDISNFKYINETYGYETGDLVLRKLAECILEIKGKNLYSIARVHSDNIVMAVRTEKKFQMEEIAQKVDEDNGMMTRTLQEYVRDNMVSIRSGLFLTADKRLPVEDAVSNAAYACKESKRRSNYKCMIFTDELMREYKKQITFLRELQGALGNKELVVYMQPKIKDDGKTVIGGEALIRWKKSDNEMIYPNDFILVFEKSGAIVDVDFFVFRETFAYLRQRLDDNLPVVPISMNVSRAHLENDRIMEYIDSLQKEYNIDSSLLEFELTERIYIENLDKAVRLINWLRARSIKVSMDDFGSGYSSLNMLNKMPVDIMKIDRIFMKDIPDRGNACIILESVIHMAKRLGVKVICEGVETKEQYEYLRSIGCDGMQGYYFGKPMPIEEFNEFLEARNYANRNGI